MKVKDLKVHRLIGDLFRWPLQMSGSNKLSKEQLSLWENGYLGGEDVG
jgi:hypothetical protein